MQRSAAAIHAAADGTFARAEQSHPAFLTQQTNSSAWGNMTKASFNTTRRDTVAERAAAKSQWGQTLASAVQKRVKNEGRSKSEILLSTMKDIKTARAEAADRLYDPELAKIWNEKKRGPRNNKGRQWLNRTMSDMSSGFKKGGIQPMVDSLGPVRRDGNWWQAKAPKERNYKTTFRRGYSEIPKLRL